MSAGARTYAFREALLEPQVLPPPPTRHALLAFVIALAAVLHVGTAGWGEIHNGAEGYYAGIARARFQTQQVYTKEPPLLDWLLDGSYESFGPAPMTARLPIAFAFVGAVALTFLIGERLAGFRRGFVAALIHLCSLGAFVWGRLVTPDPLLALFVGGAVYGALAGYQEQRRRSLWFAAVAACAGFACLTRGWAALLYLAAIFVCLAAMFREARLRFRALLRWPNLLILVAIISPWAIWLRQQLSPLTGFDAIDPVPIGRFAAQHSVWWFPTVFLVLPGLLFAARKVFRPHEFELVDALPLCWVLVGFVPVLFWPGRQDHHSVTMWGGLALFAASAWDRMPAKCQIMGLCLTSAGALAVVGYAVSQPALRNWLVIGPALVLLVAVAVAIFFVMRERETVAISIILLAMVPGGLCVAEGMMRFDAQFSLADAAAVLESRLGKDGEVLFEGRPIGASSLLFYLDRPFTTVDEKTALERFAAPHPVYLVIDKMRVPFWQERLTARFHIYHQEATCGRHVLVSNQP